MRLLRVLAPVLAPLLLAAAPAGAAAAAVPLGITASSLDVAMSADGAAHVAWIARNPGAPGADYTLNVCRIPAGGTTCTPTGAVTLPFDGGATGPWIFSVGGTNRVTAVAGSSDGANSGTYATTSSTGLAASYGPRAQVAPITAADVEVAPAGNRLYVASKQRPFAVSNAADDASFTSGPVPGMGGPGDGNASALLETGPLDGTAQQVGIRPGGRPLVTISGSGSEVFRYLYGGTPFDDAQLNTAGQWSARAAFGLGEPFTRNGAYETASGFDRLWFGYEALSTELLLRRFVGADFGPAINPDCVSRRSDASAQDAPALAVGPTGLLHVAYTNANDGVVKLGYFLGREDGSAFSPYQEIYGGPDPQRDVEIAADPSGATPGIVVWTADDSVGGPLKFSRLPAATPAACPAPPAGGGGTPPGGTTPTPPKSPPIIPSVPPVKAKAAVLADVVKGLPSTKRCLSRRSFRIRLQNPKGTTIKTATVRVNGKVKATRKAGRVVAPVNLKGLPKGRYTVKISIRLTNGKTLSATRKYRTCAPKRRR